MGREEILAQLFQNIETTKGIFCKLFMSYHNVKQNDTWAQPIM